MVIFHSARVRPHCLVTGSVQRIMGEGAISIFYRSVYTYIYIYIYIYIYGMAQGSTLSTVRLPGEVGQVKSESHLPK